MTRQERQERSRRAGSTAAIGVLIVADRRESVYKGTLVPYRCSAAEESREKLDPISVLRDFVEDAL